MIVLASVIGGGSVQGLWTDQLIEILMIPAVYLGMVALFGKQLTGLVKVLSAMILLLLVMQFLPFVPMRNLPVFEAGFNGQFLFTTTVSRSLQAALITISGLGFGLFVASLGDRQHRRIIAYVLLALLINLAVSMVQFSFDGNTRIEGLLPYSINSGMFSNPNHFSTLVLASIPLLAWLFLVEAKKNTVYIIIQILLSLYLFAIGSRAGCIFGFMVAALSYFWFGIKLNRLINLVIVVLLLLAALLTAMHFSDQSSLGDGLRFEIYANTIDIIAKQLPYGTGLGSFIEIYQVYQPNEQLLPSYVNAAHNDLLQLVLEGGVLALAIVVFFLVLVIKSMFSSKFLQAVGLSLFVMLLHSLIDYPLRTMAMMTIFAALSGIALRSPITVNLHHQRP